MKKGKKLLAIMLATVMMASAFAGCGNSGTKEDDSSKADSAETKDSETEKASDEKTSGEKVQVTVWCDTRHDLDFMTEKIDAFNATSDTIEIVYEVYTDNYQQALQLALDTDKGPDIIGTGSNGGTILEQGAGLNLYDYMTEEQLAYYGDDLRVGLSSLDPSVLITIPWSASCVRLVYNKDIFKAAGLVDENGEATPPTTYAEVVEYARIITEKLSDQGIYGYAMNLKSAGSALGRSLETCVMLNVGLRSGYNVKTCTYEFEKYIETADMFKQMYDEGSMFPGIDQLDIDPLRTEFAAGHIGMYMSFTGAEPGVYASQFPTDADWDFYLLPAAETAGEYTSRQSNGAGGRFGINKDTKHLEETLEVFWFLYSEELAEEHYAEGLSISAVTAIAESYQPEIISEMPYMAIRSETDTTPWTAVSGVAVDGEDYNSVFAGYILGIPGYEDIESLCADLNERYTTALKRGIEDGTAVAWTVSEDTAWDKMATAEKIAVTVDMLGE